MTDVSLDVLYNISKRVNEPMVHGLAHGPFVLRMLPCSPLQAWLVLANIMRTGTLVTPWSNHVIHQFLTDPIATLFMPLVITSNEAVNSFCQSKRQMVVGVKHTRFVTYLSNAYVYLAFR